jgi:lysozyme family protein
MSQNNFKNCLDLVLKSEGGWVDGNKIGDSGGETNLGVTKRVWEEWVGHTVQSLKSLTKEDVVPLYEQKYWRPTYCEVLPRGLDLLVFSMGINAGPGRSIKVLQQSIGCVSDGIIGPTTMGLIKQANVTDTIAKFSNARREYYHSLKTFPMFGKGWLARVDREENEAINMIKNG